MGKIKKLHFNEIVGPYATLSPTDLYPITVTSAVYDELGRNLDEILDNLISIGANGSDGSTGQDGNNGNNGNNGSNGGQGGSGGKDPSSEEIQEIKDSLEDAQAAIEALLKKLQSYIDNANGDIGAAAGDLTAIEAKIAAANKLIAEKTEKLNEAIDALNGRCDELATQIGVVDPSTGEPDLTAVWAAIHTNETNIAALGKLNINADEFSLLYANYVSYVTGSGSSEKAYFTYWCLDDNGKIIKYTDGYYVIVAKVDDTYSPTLKYNPSTGDLKVITDSGWTYKSAASIGELVVKSACLTLLTAEGISATLLNDSGFLSELNRTAKEAVSTYLSGDGEDAGYGSLISLNSTLIDHILANYVCYESNGRHYPYYYVVNKSTGKFVTDNLGGYLVSTNLGASSTVFKWFNPTSESLTSATHTYNSTTYNYAGPAVTRNLTAMTQTADSWAAAVSSSSNGLASKSFVTAEVGSVSSGVAEAISAAETAMSDVKVVKDKISLVSALYVTHTVGSGDSATTYFAYYPTSSTSTGEIKDIVFYNKDASPTTYYALYNTKKETYGTNTNANDNKVTTSGSGTPGVIVTKKAGTLSVSEDLVLATIQNNATGVRSALSLTDEEINAIVGGGGSTAGMTITPDKIKLGVGSDDNATLFTIEDDKVVSSSKLVSSFLAVTNPKDQTLTLGSKEVMWLCTYGQAKAAVKAATGKDKIVNASSALKDDDPVVLMKAANGDFFVLNPLLFREGGATQTISCYATELKVYDSDLKPLQTYVLELLSKTISATSPAYYLLKLADGKSYYTSGPSATSTKLNNRYYITSITNNAEPLLIYNSKYARYDEVPCTTFTIYYFLNGQVNNIKNIFITNNGNVPVCTYNGNIITVDLYDSTMHGVEQGPPIKSRCIIKGSLLAIQTDESGKISIAGGAATNLKVAKTHQPNSETEFYDSVSLVEHQFKIIPSGSSFYLLPGTITSPNKEYVYNMLHDLGLLGGMSL